MKLVPLLAASSLLLGSCVVPSAAAVTASPAAYSVGTFEPYLDPYGAWVTVPGYGRTWQPSPYVVGNDFYPYGTGGRWVYTSAGWVFESEYPFGWAVFHYGRWMRHVDFGWLWVPGSEWGPSWVSWRMGGPYVGWAPLGPRGYLGLNQRDWCFVPADRFTVRNVRGYSAGDYEFHRAVSVTGPVRSSRAGPPPQYVSRATGAPIVPVPVEQVRSAGRVPPPPPPPGRATAAGPLRVDQQPRPPTGWREDRSQQRMQQLPPPPGAGGGFQQRSDDASPPPQQPRFGAPQYQAAPPPPPAPAPAPAPQRRFDSSPYKAAPPPPSAPAQPRFESTPYRAAPPPPAMSAPAQPAPSSKRTSPRAPPPPPPRR